MDGINLETETLKFCTDRLSLLDDISTHPYLLKDEKLSFMKKDIKFDFDSIWDREEKGLFTSIAFCPGVINLMRLGTVIPAWSDFLIKIHPDGKFEWKSPDGAYQIHSHGVRGEGQFNGFKKDYVNLKFISPWLFYGNFKEKATPFFFMQPWLHEEERWEVAQGVQTPFFGQTPNVNVLIKIPEKETKKIFIRQGTPLCYILPFGKFWNKIELYREEVIDPSSQFSRLSFTNWKRFLIRGKR